MVETHRVRPLLGCFVEIGLRESNSAAQQACTQAFEAISLVDKLLSFQNPDSELSQLNRARGEALTVHPITARVLRLAKWVMRVSDDLFNCTVGGALVRQGVLPNMMIAPTLEVGCRSDVELRGRLARLARPVLITLDGIAKGYAVDCAITVLQRNGMSAGWVNAGGDLRVFGDIALPVHRREMDDSVRALGHLRNAALATSRVAEGPDTRHPGFIVGKHQAPTKGVWSVLARRAWQADALTKIVALAPTCTRDRLLERCGARLLPATELL
jgi:thiamine biosynthesis lipoprotein